MRILVVEEDGQYRLYTRSEAGTLPAGERLHKGGEYPIERYVYSTRETAEDAARALEAYLETYHATRQGKRKPVARRGVSRNRKGSNQRRHDHPDQPSLWD